MIATVVLHTPATWTPEQLTTAAETLAAPADVFDASFLTEWDIKSVDVQVGARDAWWGRVAPRGPRGAHGGQGPGGCACVRAGVCPRWYRMLAAKKQEPLRCSSSA